MVLHHRFVDLIDELVFIGGIRARRVQVFRLLGERIVIDVAPGLVGPVGVVRTGETGAGHEYEDETIQP
jgi:hypothetical protein